MSIFLDECFYSLLFRSTLLLFSSVLKDRKRGILARSQKDSYNSFMRLAFLLDFSVFILLNVLFNLFLLPSLLYLLFEMDLDFDSNLEGFYLVKYCNTFFSRKFVIFWKFTFGAKNKSVDLIFFFKILSLTTKFLI